VGPRTGVDDHRRHAFFEGPVDALHHLALVVGLKHSTARPARRPAHHGGVDLGQRGRAVLGRVALAEHVEVDAVEHEDGLHLNCPFNAEIAGAGRRVI
jgi:hypothetical protein